MTFDLLGGRTKLVTQISKLTVAYVCLIHINVICLLNMTVKVSNREPCFSE